MEYLTHSTREGERWCDVAAQYYGDATKMNLLVEDNPDVALLEILPPGTALRVRIIERNEVKTANESLPPWKR